MKIHNIVEGFTNLFLFIVESFLGLRFLLKLFGANSENGFVSWIYDMSAELLQPFRGIFPNAEFDNNFVFEFSTLFAMLMYAVAGMLVIALVDALITPAKSSKKR